MVEKVPTKGSPTNVGNVGLNLVETAIVNRMIKEYQAGVYAHELYQALRKLLKDLGHENMSAEEFEGILLKLPEEEVGKKWRFYPKRKDPIIPGEKPKDKPNLPIAE